MALDRTDITPTDDDGSLTVGTVLDAAFFDAVYDEIDAELAAVSSPNNLDYDLLPDADGTRKLGSAAKSWDGSEIIALNASNLASGTVPDARLSSAVATLTGTQTLTNKRITPRVSSETSSATPTINADNVDAHSITAQAEAITSMTTNLSGTPTNFQKLIIRIKDDGTARAITWGASFEAKGVALPTTTVISKVLTVGFIYDTVTSKWGCVASAQEA